MADKDTKWPQNITGTFYVDEQCIACDACVKTAPKYFAMNDIEGHAYVHFQPETKEELELAQQALEECPVEAIGNDG